jgi:hypothetical protein
LILLQKYHYELTVHALCLYRATINGKDGLFLCQVDDFAIATNDESVYTKICNDLNAELPVPIKRHDLLTHYNGIDIIQTRDYITLHVGSYIRKIVGNPGWSDMTPITLPSMALDNEHIRSLDLATAPDTEPEHKALDSSKFRYRDDVGELIWSMITCRPALAFPVTTAADNEHIRSLDLATAPDTALVWAMITCCPALAFPVTTLSQFPTAPAASIHYAAVTRAFKYLNVMPDDSHVGVPNPMTSYQISSILAGHLSGSHHLLRRRRCIHLRLTFPLLPTPLLPLLLPSSAISLPLQHPSLTLILHERNQPWDTSDPFPRSASVILSSCPIPCINMCNHK